MNYLNNNSIYLNVIYNSLITYQTLVTGSASFALIINNGKRIEKTQPLERIILLNFFLPLTS